MKRLAVLALVFVLPAHAGFLAGVTNPNPESWPGWFQIAYGGGLFDPGNDGYITSIQFYGSGGALGGGTYELYVGLDGAPANDLSDAQAFNYGSFPGAAEQMLWSGTLPTAVDGVYNFQLSAPFDINGGSQNLLLTFVGISGQLGDTGPGTLTAGSNPLIAEFFGGYSSPVLGTGLETSFNEPPDPVTLPSSGPLLASALLAMTAVFTFARPPQRKRRRRAPWSPPPPLVVTVGVATVALFLMLVILAVHSP